MNVKDHNRKANMATTPSACQESDTVNASKMKLDTHALAMMEKLHSISFQLPYSCSEQILFVFVAYLGIYLLSIYGF